jgi:hypothetical protein
MIGFAFHIGPLTICEIFSIFFTLTLQKSEGFRFGVAKGEVVVNYCDPLATPNLEFSGFPEG